MTTSDFVHLHNHSDFSLLDGASSIPGMVKRAAELGMPALALTDHGSMFGAVEFYQEAKKAGLKPIVGMEAYVTRGSRKDRTRDTAHHLVLLARDATGFKNLMRLSSLAFLEGFYYKPRVDHEILSKYGAGLVALSACPKGEIATDLLAGDDDGAVRTATMYRDLFGAENYFLEIQNHGLEIEDRIRARVTELSRRTGIPLVATNDCHYLRHDHAGPHDVLLCIQTGKNVDDPNRMRYETDQVYFKSADEMRARFGDQPEALRATLAIAERCDLKLDFGKPLLPEFPLPPGVESAEAHLRELSGRGLRERFGADAGSAARERLEYELDVICRMGFASYMLIVRDFIEYARSRGIGVGPGRGSVAGSLVAYCLGITKVDPLKHSLYFERFLNPERVSMPDIDIDFDDLRRGEVIEYVKRKYGEESVTQIITFGTMGAKGVVRDVGRALGLAFAEVDKIAKLVPDGLGMTLERALELSPDLKNLPAKDPRFAQLLHSAQVLEGLARHASTHAAGVLITPGPLLDYVPLYRQKDESITTQWDMKSVEKAGLLKMDFLGLRTLSVLDEAVRLVAERGGPALDLDVLPEDDEPTFQVFQRADTVAIFQFESAGMRDYLKKLKPTVFDDLVAMNALYRPGPMENIPYFIDCKHGREVVRYEHAALEPILETTYGVFVYQEQVMAAANVLAGFSLAQGDELRRAMGKKRLEEMEAKRAQFVEGCGTKSIPRAKAEKIFATMEKFAGYGFNRCVWSSTEICDAVTGERTTVGDLHRNARPFTIHALDPRGRLVARRVLDVTSSGRAPVWELQTAQGRKIVATGNHPFRTLDGWRELQELRPDDYVATARALPVPTRASMPRHELIALAGLLAEGNTCHPTTLNFYANDREMIADFMAAITTFESTSARVYVRPNSNRMEVQANLGRVREGAVEYLAIEGSLALVCDAPGRRSGAFRWAERLGILGCKATTKRVPAVVFTLRDSDLELFMGRLWSGDGFVSDERRSAPFYATSSEGLARDVRDLLLRLGIMSGIHHKVFKYRGGQKAGFTVHLVGDHARERFLERIAPHLVARKKAVERLRRQLHQRRYRMSVDVIPVAVWEEIDQECRRNGLTWEGLQERSGMRKLGSPGHGGRRGYRRETIRRVGEALQSRSLVDLGSSDVFWDRIVSILPSGEHETFDLTIEDQHNFLADGFIVHNSHSAAYALLAYQSGYLKAHHPAEFMAATLTSEAADSARIATLIEECRRMKLEIRPPDVNRSEWRFTIEDGAIRYGLGGVRNVGQGAVEALVQARAEGGPFKDLFDLCCRAGGKLNRRVLESLVGAGACDGFGGERGALFAACERMLAHAASIERERASGQSSLFGEGPSHAPIVAPPLIPTEPWAARDRSAREKESLGFYFSEHPLEPMREVLAEVASHSVEAALAAPDQTEVRLVGLASELRTFATRAGKVMASITLEDLTGRIECTLFPDTFEAAKPLLEGDAPLLVFGRIETRDLGTKLLVSQLEPFETARASYRPALHLQIRAEELSVHWLERVDQLLSGHPGDCEVYLHIVMPDRSRKACRSRRFRIGRDESVVEALRNEFPNVRAQWGRSVR